MISCGSFAANDKRTARDDWIQNGQTTADNEMDVRFRMTSPQREVSFGDAWEWPNEEDKSPMTRFERTNTSLATFMHMAFSYFSSSLLHCGYSCCVLFRSLQLMNDKTFSGWPYHTCYPWIIMGSKLCVLRKILFFLRRGFLINRDRWCVGELVVWTTCRLVHPLRLAMAVSKRRCVVAIP